MYLGRYYHTVEEAGRVSVPAEFRVLLGKACVITRGLDGCLFLFSATEWKQFSSGLERAVLTKKMHRDFIRLMANDAVAIELDDQGRVLLPEYLRTLSGINKQTVFAGSGKYIEVWDRNRYHAYLDEIEKHAEDIAEQFEVLDSVKDNNEQR